MDRYDQLWDDIGDALLDMNDDELIAVYNAYCEEMNDNDSEIIEMDMLDSWFKGGTATEILRDCGEINIDDDYFTFDGNVWVSFTALDDGPIDYQTLTQYIVDNDNSLGNSDIEDILAGYRE